MKEKSLLLPTPAVRSILEGGQNIIRLPIKPQPKSRLAYIIMGHKMGSWHYPGPDAWEYWGDESLKLAEDITDKDLSRYWHPPCHANESLYVKETWTRGYIESSDSEGVADTWFEERLTTGGEGFLDAQTCWYYRADMDEATAKSLGIRWHSAIHMPREAARLFLHVEQVTTELSINPAGEPEWMWKICYRKIKNLETDGR